MSYVGNTNTTQAFTAAVDYFSGNGSTVAFTLSRPVASTAQVQVVVNNVPQNPTDAFTVLNNTITFTGAPSSGTNNIYVQYTSPITQIMQPGQGTVTSNSFGLITDFTTTGNTVLGNASTDTLNVGNGGLVKDASGNVGIGTSSPNLSGSSTALTVNTGTAGNFAALEIASGGSLNYHINANNSAIYHVAAGTRPWIVYTNGSERMRIDSSGRVITPYQPAFSVENITNGSAINTPFLFTGIAVNRGSHYNAATGLFTAPVAGVYQFLARLQCGYNGNYVYIWLYKNGAITGIEGHTNMAGYTQWQDVSVLQQLTLAAGDTVGIINGSGATSGVSSTCSFAGFFLG